MSGNSSASFRNSGWSNYFNLNFSFVLFSHNFFSFPKVFSWISLENTNLSLFWRFYSMRWGKFNGIFVEFQTNYSICRFFITRFSWFRSKKFLVRCRRLLWCVIRRQETLKCGGRHVRAESVLKKRKLQLLWILAGTIVCCWRKIPRLKHFRIRQSGTKLSRRNACGMQTSPHFWSLSLKQRRKIMNRRRWNFILEERKIDQISRRKLRGSRGLATVRSF